MLTTLQAILHRSFMQPKASFSYSYKLTAGDRSSTVVKVLCYKSEGRLFDPCWCQWIFHWHKILPIAPRPWGRLSLYQKWVPGVFLGGKGGGYVRLTTLPPSCAVVMRSGKLNFLELSGPLRACNGTALQANSWSLSGATKIHSALPILPTLTPI
jgi:hypothetical protein